MVIVFSLTEKNSLNNIDNWLEEINSYCDNKNVVIILIGNKDDDTKNYFSSESKIKDDL